MKKFNIKSYDGRNLSGEWEVTFKIDGIRCERTSDGWVSKSGKPTLHGLEDYVEITKEGEIYEYFTGDLASSNAIRQHNHKCDLNDLYRLWPVPDYRLRFITIEDPDANRIERLLQHAINRGYEGIMLRQGDMVWRVKPFETYDVKVLDVYEGFTGKNRGRLGGVKTEMGDVGLGWSDDERDIYLKYPEEIVGRIIEVKAQGLTPDNKFRHGSKIRIRWDKE